MSLVFCLATVTLVTCFPISVLAFGLGGVNLKLAAYHNAPYNVLAQQPDGNFSSYGTDTYIFEWLSKRLNFTYTIYPVIDKAVIGKLGVYEAIFEKIISQEVDGLLGTVVISPDRARRMDFTCGLAWSEPYNLVAPKPKLESRLFAFIRPFQPMVWFALLLSLIVFVGMMSLFSWVYQHDSRFTSLKPRRNTTAREKFQPSYITDNISYYTLYVVCVLSNHGSFVNYYYYSFRIMNGCLLLATLVLVNSYSSIVVSSLTLPTQTPAVNSLEDLVSNDEVFLILTKTVVIGQIILGAKSGTYAQLGNQLRNHPDRVFSDFSSAYSKVNEGHFALPWLTSSNRDFVAKQFRKTGKCQLQLSDPLPMTNFLSALLLQKGSKYTSFISFGLVELWQTGFTRYWIEHMSPSAYECFDRNPPKSTTSLPIKLVDLTSAFLIFGIGGGLSILTFLVELVGYGRNANSKDEKSTKAKHNS